MRVESVAGDTWQASTPCKPHDCGENNLLLLYSPRTGSVVGHLVENGRVTLLGRPSAAVAARLQQMWNKGFRQR